MSNPTIDGMVEPERVYRPVFFVSRWFKTWAIKCGSCGKDFVAFSWFGKPKCPYCEAINRPKATPMDW